MYRLKDTNSSSSAVSTPSFNDVATAEGTQPAAGDLVTLSTEKEVPVSSLARPLAVEESSIGSLTSGTGLGPMPGKVPRFVWSAEQKQLLRSILVSFVDIVKKWKGYEQ